MDTRASWLLLRVLEVVGELVLQHVATRALVDRNIKSCDPKGNDA